MARSPSSAGSPGREPWEEGGEEGAAAKPELRSGAAGLRSGSAEAEIIEATAVKPWGSTMDGVV